MEEKVRKGVSGREGERELSNMQILAFAKSKYKVEALLGYRADDGRQRQWAQPVRRSHSLPDDSPWKTGKRGKRGFIK